MNRVELSLTAESDTIQLGGLIAQELNGVGRVFLSGDLGAGKTTLCRGILRAMDHYGAVKSPTFTLVEPYNLEQGQVFHFDLYRLSEPDELEYIGIDEYFDDNNLCLVEWPEKADGTLPDADLDISLILRADGRKAILHANSETGKKVIEKVINKLNAKEHKEIS